jgi:hypothetical protein
MFASKKFAFPASRWEGARIFPDAVTAIIPGVVDTERTGASGRDALDRLVGPRV